MKDSLFLDNIFKKISQSKKYQTLYPKTIENILNFYSSKYPQNLLEQQTRKTLHQIFSSYFRSHINFIKIFQKFKNNITSNQQNLKSNLQQILKIHSSTNERLPILKDFYQKIFAYTQKPKTIIDLACGFNSLTYPWMNLEKGSRYYGYDISLSQTVFLKQIFALIKDKNTLFTFETKDLFLDSFPIKADVIFLFKFLPLMQYQSHISLIDLISKLKFRFLVLSFPTKSLSGKEKGMIDFYRSLLLANFKGNNQTLKKISFKQELIYIFKNQNGTTKT